LQDAQASKSSYYQRFFESGGGKEIVDRIVMMSYAPIPAAEEEKSRFNYGADGEEDFDEIFQNTSAWKAYAPIILLLYLAVGAITFAIVEDFKFNEALYFTVVTFTTVGYGDMSPQTSPGRLFFIIYILGALTVIGYCFGAMIDIFSNKLRSKVANEGCWVTLSNCLGGSKWITLAASYSCLLLLTLVGTLFLHFLEDLSIVDAAYWTVATFTTVGYGDLTLSGKAETRWFLTFFILVGVPVCTVVMFNIVDLIVSDTNETSFKKLVEFGVSREMLQDMDINKDRKVTKFEFLTFFLVKMKKVDAADLQDCSELFDELDLDGSGFLNENDAIRAQKRRLDVHPGAPAVSKQSC